MDQLKKKEVKSAIESMMFVWGNPLDPESAAEVCEIKKSEAVECITELMDEYRNERRGIQIREIDGKYQFCTNFENYDFVKRLCSPVKARKLTQSALEVLAIIAYKQPVTRVEIDGVRGIKSDSAIDTLVKKELIEEKGRSESVGKPILYGTTKLFLEKFGISKLSELPNIDDIEGAVKRGDEIGLSDEEISQSDEFQMKLNLDSNPEKKDD